MTTLVGGPLDGTERDMPASVWLARIFTAESDAMPRVMYERVGTRFEYVVLSDEEIAQYRRTRREAAA